MKKVTIEVFGMPDSYPKACGCGPQLTIKEMFEDFEAKIKDQDFSDHVDLTFIKADNLVDYDYVTKAIKSGYKLPMTAINGRVRFHNGLPALQIMKLVRQQLR